MSSDVSLDALQEKSNVEVWKWWKWALIALVEDAVRIFSREANFSFVSQLEPSGTNGPIP